MKRILIVDDEKLIVFGLTRALRGKELEVKSVNTGEKALSEVTAAPYDLCFLDLCLPDMHGLEVMKKIKEMSPGTKIVIMTGSALSDAMKIEIEGAAYQLITKPFDLFEVLSMAENVLR